MLETILFVSFIIHAVTLSALYMIFKQMKQTNNSDVNKMESMMKSYVEKIQKENDELQAALQMHTPLNEPIKDKRSISLYEHHSPKVEEELVATSDEWSMEEIARQNEEDSVETTLESRVLQLHHAGLPIDMIAKQLHCGKTEASLIIQFQQEK